MIMNIIIMELNSMSKKPKKSRIKKEMQEQIKFFNWVEENKIFYPELELVFFCPNEVKVESKWEGFWLNRAGRIAGIPDIHFGVARIDGAKLYIGLKIEFKRDAFQKPRENQLKFIEKFYRAGHFTTVCHSADEGISVFFRYDGASPTKNHIEYGRG